jgi:hypothetical protein
MDAGTIKIPEPIMEPIISRMQSVRLSFLEVFMEGKINKTE